SIAARIVSKNRDCTSRMDSGSSCSPSAVEPVTSQNTIETVLRTSRAGATGESGVEHAGQNAKSSGLSRPQFGQVIIRPRVRPTAAGRDSLMPCPAGADGGRGPGVFHEPTLGRPEISSGTIPPAL